MKNRLKIMLGILLVGSLTGCTGNFEEYNTCLLYTSDAADE